MMVRLRVNLYVPAKAVYISFQPKADHAAFIILSDVGWQVDSKEIVLVQLIVPFARKIELESKFIHLINYYY